MATEQMRVRPNGRHFHIGLWIDDEEVSSLEINNLVMRIGSSPVRMGGIGGVGTPHRHRNKGYSRRVLEYSTQWMAENGFDCATLFGINDFYDKYGYAVCLPECRIEVATWDAEQAEATLHVRPFTPDDLPALREIYAANNGDLNGSIVRDEEIGWFRKGSWYRHTPQIVVFTKDSGEVAAYAAYDAKDGADVIRDSVTLCEVGVQNAAYYADIAHWAAERAIMLRVEKIAFLVPPEGLCAVYLTQYGARQTNEFARCGEGMGRLLQLESFLQNTLPEWTRRAATASGLSTEASLHFTTDIGEATLNWNGSQVTLSSEKAASGRVRLPQWRLMQLVMGYYGADILPAMPKVEASGDLSLLNALFPRRLPYMWRCDHF